MRPTAFKLTAAILILVGITQSTKAQDDRSMLLPLPFLFYAFLLMPVLAVWVILAIATSPDANSSFWNLAKVPYNTSKGGISVSYTPWLKDILNDVYLASASRIL